MYYQKISQKLCNATLDKSEEKKIYFGVIKIINKN